MSRPASPAAHEWINDYLQANAALLEAEPEFRRWLEEDYAPIAGGWQY
jgi:hypothetical protein